MKKLPLVSIGFLAYNRQALTREALNSLLQQSYNHIEIIISDDASQDETEKVCRAIGKKDSRVTYFRQKRNLGIPRNSNFVLSKAKGTYFMWASNDDLWHKDYIKELVSLLESNPNAVLSMSNYQLFKDRKKQLSTFGFRKKNSPPAFLKYYLSHPPLLVWGLFRRKVLRETGGFHIDSRPFLYQGSDNLTVFKTLLLGDFMFTHKYLFYKRDSGFGMDPDTILRKGNYSQELNGKLLRYSLYPLMFSYDAYYLLKYIGSSPFSVLDKAILAIYVAAYWLQTNTQLLFKSIAGIGSVFVGLWIRTKKRLFSID